MARERNEPRSAKAPPKNAELDAKARKLRENLARRKARQRALKDEDKSDGED